MVRHFEYEAVVGEPQLKDAVSGFVKSLFYLRSCGKFTYSKDGKCDMGKMEEKDVWCESFPLVYICATSPEFDKDISEFIDEFCKALKASEERNGERKGSIYVELYEIKTEERFMITSTTEEVWEKYTLNFTMKDNFEMKVRHGRRIQDAIVKMCKEACDQPDASARTCVEESKIGDKFITKYSDVQPFRYRISHETGHKGFKLLNMFGFS
ncbi:uncharacterized protein LOC108864092 [Galendromus occidentalis]|uniref:Autophagy-related protein 101 n=1 Tax=Galendromus occidentalis TaxID=34638 RepID=A0AAJ7P9I2_9ACAR|nr:uncharacterized protein LOC108864092 [Galendromus occidentalis]